jgi:predicted phosphoadenosine phosphosulfate sulfurtransferase
MNVYQAAEKRIKLLFNAADNIIVSFSGGKDSGIVLFLTAKIARELGRRFSVLHLDYECQYQATTEYVLDAHSNVTDVTDIYHCCVEFNAGCATHMNSPYWRPWADADKSIWVRQMPPNAYTAKDFDFYRPDITDYEFGHEFAPWHHKHKGAKRTIVLLGLRMQESLNRWRALEQDQGNRVDGHKWWKHLPNGTDVAHPIYDWQTEDIWRAYAKEDWPNNRLYDLMHQAGLSIHEMRVASPFLQQGIASLHLYRVLEPHTWGKMVSRVNGVNFAAIYGNTTAMGWRNITKPKHFTWKEYCDFLLDTLPKDTAQRYREKLAVSLKFWRTKGGKLPIEAIEDLDKNMIEYKKNEKGEVKLDYIDEIQSSYFNKIPSYKRMCVCILKNDILCKYMGFAATKEEQERKLSTLNRYMNL